jgi:hypothetical protein
MKDFEGNLVKQFTDFKIKPPEQPGHMEHLYADYVEMVALFSGRNFVTSADILDRLQDEGFIRTEDDAEDSNAAEKNDKNESWVNEIFRILEERSIIYQNDYPFNYINQKIVLAENINHQHELYLTLLLCSNLTLFKNVRSSLTSDFEMISAYALVGYLPSHAKVRQFGKQTEFDGAAAKIKIRQLATEMKVQVNEHELANVSDKNKMERGLDVVGWIPFADGCPNMISILGQCACGLDWYNKHHDTKRFVNYLNFYKKDPIHAMFIPFNLNGKYSSTEFYRGDDIEKETLLFERKRLTEFFGNQEEFNKLESKAILEKCLTYIEDIL